MLPEISPHDPCQLVEMAKLPQPFSLQDCAPFYGEPKGLRVSPSISIVVARLLGAGALRVAAGKYYVTSDGLALLAGTLPAVTPSITDRRLEDLEEQEECRGAVPALSKKGEGALREADTGTAPSLLSPGQAGTFSVESSEGNDAKGLGVSCTQPGGSRVDRTVGHSHTSPVALAPDQGGATGLFDPSEP